MMEMGRKSKVLVVVLVFLWLQLVSSTIFKGGSLYSTCCSKCAQSNPFMNTKYNPTRLQSFTIFGVKYQNPASWFATVFRGFPIAYTWQFLEKFQDFEERINNGHASCGGPVNQFYYEDIPDTTLDIIYESLINVLEYTSPNENYSQNLGLTYAATLRSARARRPNVLTSVKKQYLMFVAANTLNSLKFNKQNYFSNCIRQANEEYQNGETPYVPEENDQLDDMLPSWGFEDYFQWKQAPVDLSILKGTETYYKFIDDGNLSSKCPKVPTGLNPNFKVRRRRLQQSIQELSTFNVYLQRNRAAEDSLLTPAKVDLLINIPMTGDVVYSTDPNVVNNGFSAGETQFSVWAYIAAQLLGPTIYCHDPAIKGLLESSCPATCDKTC